MHAVEWGNDDGVNIHDRTYRAHKRTEGLINLATVAGLTAPHLFAARVTRPPHSPPLLRTAGFSPSSKIFFFDLSSIF